MTADASEGPGREERAGATAPARVITLIHGTFDRDAAWTHEGPLCDALAGEDLPGATHFSRFCWSGRNSHTARIAAGEALAEHLGRLTEQYPDARHHLIGHSHGGNIMMYAMKQTDLAERVTALVTLATPFLSLHRHRLPVGVFNSVIILLILVAGEIALNLSDLWVHGWPENPWNPPTEESRLEAWWVLAPLAGLLGFWILGSTVSTLSYRGGRFGPRQLFAIARRQPEGDAIIARELDRLELSPDETRQHWQLDRLLVVRPIGDEASMALIFSQFMCWLQYRLQRFTVEAFGFLLRFSGVSTLMRGEVFTKMDGDDLGLFRIIWSLIKFFACFVLVALFVALVAPFFQYVFGLVDATIGYIFQIFDAVFDEEVDHTGYVLVDLVILLIGLIAILWFVIYLPAVVFLATLPLMGLISLIGMVISMLSALAFGRDAMIWSHFAATSAEATPPGPSRVFLQAAQGDSEAGMAHNIIYRDPQVIEEIVTWIRGREAALNPTSQRKVPDDQDHERSGA